VKLSRPCSTQVGLMVALSRKLYCSTNMLTFWAFRVYRETEETICFELSMFFVPFVNNTFVSAAGDCERT
jgi:hypothetical protein